MKVIKPGRPQQGWAKEYTCTGVGNENEGCGAVLLVEEADLYKTYHHCRDEVDTFITFKCPSCTCETDIKDVPYNIQEKLPSKDTWMKRQRILNKKIENISNGGR